MKKKVAIPHAFKTFQALRSFGYTLNSSIADLIDNSIAANANNIWIDIHHSENGFSLCMADDGDGMSETQLFDAITIGTDQDYAEEDLGKFGLGMKSASLAHCNQLTVVSRTSDNSKVSACSWDMNVVKETNEWNFLEYSKPDIINLLSKHTINNNYRTIVVWNDMFLLDDEIQSKQTEKKALNFVERTIYRLAVHIGWVFHRFLDKNFKTSSNLNIVLNGITIEPIDPFQRDQSHTEEIHFEKSEQFYRNHEKNHAIMIAGYVLPHKDQFSSKQDWEKAKGNLQWNDAQGYYIYRSNRLIKFGGWLGTKGKDEHTKLARISIDVPTEYDDEFMLTVDKSRVKLPEYLKYHLKEKINKRVTRAADEKYRKKKRQKKVVTNRIRKSSEGLNKVTGEIIDNSKISISRTDVSQNNSHVKVDNKEGSFFPNSYAESLMNHLEKHLRIKSGKVEGGDLWKLICDPNNNDFTVVINEDHPFYEYVYEKNSSNKHSTSVADSIFYTLAFAEICLRSQSTENIFSDMRNIMSTVLDRLVDEGIV